MPDEFRVYLGRLYELALDVEGEHLRASVDGQVLFEVVDRDPALASGAVAFVCEEGCMTSEALEVTALRDRRPPFD